MNDLDLRSVERELCRIPDVRAARIVVGPDTEPVEVHILAVPGKHAKQVVRDIQSVAMASVGLEIDHRIVSVVQLEDPVVEPPASPGAPAAPASAAQAPEAVAVSAAPGPAPVPPAADPEGAASSNGRAEAAPTSPPAGTNTGERPVVESVHLLRRGPRCSAEVALRAGEVEATGTVEGSAAASATLRLVAEATLDALRQLDGTAAQVTVETATVTSFGDRPVAMAVLVLMVPPYEELLTGSAPVRSMGEHEAVARAVLDATNRRLRPPR
ncbi:MAG TPA: hypothetical protein VMN58_11510 [Acidimicrobiales bacterium]|nr:hypothetical protein [Acidimicrobiales bacterium]